uniref:Transcription factor CBF/NF-Y/archaeal histone domain-containing protein n=1 Tax=Meloidogyne incognita TaxID=6306 RepID=A0A914MD60_MELIC
MDSAEFNNNLRPDSPPKNLEEFWPKQQGKIDRMTMTNFREVNRHSELPIARIKKIMKIEEGLKTQMIGSEAPVLLAKAAEIFIEELTLRSWLNTQENRRKTIQKADVAAGAEKSEMFDFLIDILPRDDMQKEESSDQTDIEREENVQYVLQCTDGSMPALSECLMTLENGQVIQATQIGQPIPLNCGPGQPIIMTLPGSGDQQQFQVVQMPGDDQNLG